MVLLANNRRVTNQFLMEGYNLAGARLALAAAHAVGSSAASAAATAASAAATAVNSLTSKPSSPAQCLTSLLNVERETGFALEYAWAPPPDAL